MDKVLLDIACERLARAIRDNGGARRDYADSWRRMAMTSSTSRRRDPARTGRGQ